MANKRLVIFGAGATIIAMVILAVAWKSLFTEREPVYQGRTVAYWLAEVFTTNQPQALQVLSEMGPEGIPPLIRAFNRRDTPLNDFYRKMYPKLPGWLQRHLTRPLPAEQIWSAADLALLNNMNGRLALPELVRMLGDQKNPARRYLIDPVERWTGPGDTECVPALIQCLQDPHATVRQGAVSCLKILGSQASAAIPALTSALNDSTAGVKVSAARALWYISQQTNPAAATLEAVIKTTPSDPMAYWAAVYLADIDPGDTNGIPVVLAVLQNRNGVLSVSAAATLGKYGPSAAAAVPVLAQLIENGSPQLKAVALESLKKIDPESAAGYEHQ